MNYEGVATPAERQIISGWESGIRKPWDKQVACGDDSAKGLRKRKVLEHKL
jgi:hypothetical protein